MIANTKIFIFSLFCVKIKLIYSHVSIFDFSWWEKTFYFTEVYIIMVDILAIATL